ncbi:MAG: hypothetical protein NT045_05400 [Candidatus Aureabacteria bacterium]|nr:hypothetical protein [Candidatus Auribacterota bacterium]
MSLGRRVIVIAAWVPVAVTLALLWEQARRTCPDPRAVVAGLLSHADARPRWRNLSSFGNDLEMEKWQRSGALLARAGEWGRVTFRKGVEYSGIRLSDYTFGPARVRDWSPYRVLKWEMLAPSNVTRPLVLTVKDVGNRRFSRSFTLAPGSAMAATVGLAEMNPFIDLTRVTEVYFFLQNPEVDTVVDLKDLRLEGGGADGAVIGTPCVVFERLEIPESAARGETVTLHLTLSLTERQDSPFMLFVHCYPEHERSVEIPSHRAGYIHLETRPFLPVPQWKPRAPQRLGPYAVYLPRSIPAGRYLIEAGLFNDLSPGNGPRGVPYHGAYDYGGSFPKCRYTDPQRSDFVIGTLQVR